MAFDEELTFTSWVSFGSHVRTARNRIPKAILAGLQEAAISILYRTQQKFGVYQPAVGPFAAWAALSDSTLIRRGQRGINPNDEPLLESGDLLASYGIEQDPSTSETVVGSDSEYAAAQETGNPINNTPPRAALGPAVLQWEAEHQAYFEEAMAGYMLQGRYFRRLTSRRAALYRSRRSIYGNTDFIGSAMGGD